MTELTPRTRVPDTAPLKRVRAIRVSLQLLRSVPNTLQAISRRHELALRLPL